MTMITARKTIVIVGLAVAAVLALPQSATAGESSTRYYLSLGDSLAEGYQPSGDLTHGYAEQLHAALAVDDPKLELVKLGCGGESSESMRFGSQPPQLVLSCGTPSFYRQRYPHKTQLAEAVAFLQSHKDKVALVTIDIGSNDLSRFDAQFNVVSCLLESSGCATETLRLVGNLRGILAELRLAAGPNVPIVGMTYYDVFAPTCFADPALLFVCDRVDGLNGQLAAAYAAAGVPVADVAGVFENGVLANAAAHVCAWTWFCSLGDVHLNTAGYGVVAQAFLDALP